MTVNKRAEHDDVEIFSAGVIIVRQEHKSFQYLLLKAFNFWDFPKGQVEVNETAIEAALREVKEETTIDDLKFNWGYEFYETPTYFRGRKVARYYIAETKRDQIELPINPELGHPEHSEWMWASRSQVIKMVTPRVREAIYWSDYFLAHDSRIG